MSDQHEEFGEDPISDLADIKRPPRGVGVPAHLSGEVMKTADRQIPFYEVIAQFHRLFEEIPRMTTREVDVRLKEMFDSFLEAAEKVGISKMSVPQLKECCGKVRVWKDAEPTAAAAPGGLRLGDRVAWLLSKLGFKSCEGCKRRQAALNEVFRGKGGR